SALDRRNPDRASVRVPSTEQYRVARARRRMARGEILGGAADGGQQHLCHVHDLDVLVAAVLRLFLRESVGQHDVAEGATDRDTTCAGGECFFGAIVVDTGAELLLHPHLRTARAAAERLLA